MKQLLIFFLLANSFPLFAQTVVFDREHFLIVNENAAIRNVSEIGYQESLTRIWENTDDIGLNVSSLALVETMIYRSLSQVNEGLKDAIQVKQIGKTLQRIYSLSDETITIAYENPVLLLFAETYIRQAKERSFLLVSEVSAFVLAEGENLLINPNVRDQLLVKIQNEIDLIASYILAVRNSMYWANVNGVLKRLNPYQADIDQNLNLINQILIHKQRLR
ncbi:hypothetical protein [Cyclobacterium marinum]|uniref:Uncharacterized protein n=1 Tax=Cyclobacterium marinum (strain ATCC 25205 / DSM 745 / LMG 13164 / NCIMB 1802) TaxID=880070 RepID=G0J7P6_CYCMS|nr:hypothetical protein [Cyclobacterium marinum]AEL26999.1 hypothetical protein Cycma_3274 [Cyclobacterium marinum DSM 745]